MCEWNLKRLEKKGRGSTSKHFPKIALDKNQIILGQLPPKKIPTKSGLVCRDTHIAESAVEEERAHYIPTNQG
jgi:hypothetical protein